MASPLILEVGKTYKNGWGAQIPITRSADCNGHTLFYSDMGLGCEDIYHATGEFFGLGQPLRHNLVEVVSMTDCQKPCPLVGIGIVGLVDGTNGLNADGSYVRLILTHKDDSKDQFLISKGAAEVVMHEIAGLLA